MGNNVEDVVKKIQKEEDEEEKNENDKFVSTSKIN